MQEVTNAPQQAPAATSSTPQAPNPGSPWAIQGQAPVVIQGPVTQKAIYDALRNARREIDNQINDVENARDNIAQQLRQPNITDFDKVGLQGRLKTLDERLVSLDLQKTKADEAVAKQAAIPGSIVPEPRQVRQGPPEEAFALAAFFMFIVGLPLTIAYARRIWRKGAPTALPQEFYDRFTRVEQSLDTIAIEVERVGEGQRFLTRMQAQQGERALGAGAADPIGAASREKVRDVRK